MSMHRRWWGGARALTLAAGLALAACKGGSSGAADATFEALPGPDKVDGKLNRLVVGERFAAAYEPSAPVKGAAKPLVTIVEYSDFQCPFCGSFASTLDELVAAYPEDVRIVFQQFPLPMHPGAEPAARAAIAAQAQGKFWAMHDSLFRTRHKTSRDELIEQADALGLDTARFGADLDDEATAQRVKQEMARARELGVRSTPTFFINGRRVGGALPPDSLQKVVDLEREGSQRLVEAGSKREEVYARYLRAALDAKGPPSAR